ncbi:MAG: hypothetical protein QOH03_141 [Kribbellaceae bacterium]|nr:hypothetical protein [Kribbellaceae bacterium]
MLALIAVVVAAGLVIWRVVPERAQYDGNVTIKPGRVVPGDVVEITLAVGFKYTSSYYLKEKGRSKKPLYYLYSASPTGRSEPSWQAASELKDGAGFAAFGLTGPGQERVVIPPPIADGEYALCVVAADLSCALLTVGR